MRENLGIIDESQRGKVACNVVTRCSLIEACYVFDVTLDVIIYVNEIFSECQSLNFSLIKKFRRAFFTLQLDSISRNILFVELNPREVGGTFRTKKLIISLLFHYYSLAVCLLFFSRFLFADSFVDYYLVNSRRNCFYLWLDGRTRAKSSESEIVNKLRNYSANNLLSPLPDQIQFSIRRTLSGFSFFIPPRFTEL